MPAPLNTALLFLVNTLFDLYLLLLVIRLLLAFAGANYFNPIIQFIIKFTQPLVGPLRRMIPNRYGIEFSTLLIILVIEMVKFFLVGLLSIGMANILGLIVLAVADTLKLILNTYFFAILIQAILSWIQPYSPANQILAAMTTPIIRPLQRVIPPIGGFDITPIPALIILQLLIILVAGPLFALGTGIAFG